MRGANAMSLMASAASGALVPLVPFLEILQDQLLPFLLPSDMLRFTRASQQVVRHLRQDAGHDQMVQSFESFDKLSEVLFIQNAMIHCFKTGETERFRVANAA